MTKYYRGFFYENEDDLRGQLSVDEFLDFLYEKRNKEYLSEAFLDLDVDDNDTYTSLLTESCNDDATLAMDTYHLRLAEGMTQKEFAEVIGVGVSTISKIENEKGNISEQVKLKIQNYFYERY